MQVNLTPQQVAEAIAHQCDQLAAKCRRPLGQMQQQDDNLREIKHQYEAIGELVKVLVGDV